MSLVIEQRSRISGQIRLATLAVARFALDKRDVYSNSYELVKASGLVIPLPTITRGGLVVGKGDHGFWEQLPIGVAVVLVGADVIFPSGGDYSRSIVFHKICRRADIELFYTVFSYSNLSVKIRRLAVNQNVMSYGN